MLELDDKTSKKPPLHKSVLSRLSSQLLPTVLLLVIAYLLLKDTTAIHFVVESSKASRLFTSSTVVFFFYNIAVLKIFKRPDESAEKMISRLEENHHFIIPVSALVFIGYATALVLSIGLYVQQQ